MYTTKYIYTHTLSVLSAELPRHFDSKGIDIYIHTHTHMNLYKQIHIHTHIVGSQRRVTSYLDTSIPKG